MQPQVPTGTGAPAGGEGGVESALCCSKILELKPQAAFVSEKA